MNSFEALTDGQIPAVPSVDAAAGRGSHGGGPGTAGSDPGWDRWPELAQGPSDQTARLRSAPRQRQGASFGDTPPGAEPLPSHRAIGSDGSGFTQTYAGRSVMITGAGGSIGLELCRQILASGPSRIVLFELGEHALYTAERTVQSLIRANGMASCVEVRAVMGSVADARLIADVMRAAKVTDVLHAAAYKHVHLVEANPRAGLVNNTIGTAVLAQAARDCGVRRFVLVSTDKAVRPAGIMGASKRLAEIVVQDLASRPGPTVYSIVRFGNVIGSSGSVIPLFHEQIAAGGPVTLTHPGATRYFMTLAEAAHLVLAAGSIACGGEIFLLDMGRPVLIRDLARRMIAAAGRTIRDAANPFGDIELVTTRLRPGEKLHEDLTTGLRVERTLHPKILRLCEGCPSELETAGAMRDLRRAIETGDDADLRATVARCLPGSVFGNGATATAVSAADGARRADPEAQEEGQPKTLARGSRS